MGSRRTGFAAAALTWLGVLLLISAGCGAGAGESGGAGSDPSVDLGPGGDASAQGDAVGDPGKLPVPDPGVGDLPGDATEPPPADIPPSDDGPDPGENELPGWDLGGAEDALLEVVDPGPSDPGAEVAVDEGPPPQDLPVEDEGADVAGVDPGEAEVVSDAGPPDPGAPDPGAPDPGAPDPGTPDPGTPDPGTPDPGTPDPGTPDPGPADGGAQQDVVAADTLPDVPCIPNCAGKECGFDGCAGMCGKCLLSQICTKAGVCYCPTLVCAGACCVLGQICVSGQCVDPPPPPVRLSFGQVTSTSAEILIENDVPISGFQFTTSGLVLTGAHGGLAEEAGYQISTTKNFILAMSFSLELIPAGKGVLIILDFNPKAPGSNFCIGALVFPGAQNQTLDAKADPECFFFGL